MGQNDSFGFFENPVFFGQRQVAAGLHINNRLLGFGFDEKFHASIVFAKILKDRKGKEKHAEDHHQRHDRICNHQLNQKPKIGTSIA